MITRLCARIKQSTKEDNVMTDSNLDITTRYSAGELAELLEAVERLAGSECLPPTEPSKNGKVLQFPYNDSKGSSKKAAKSLI